MRKLYNTILISIVLFAFFGCEEKKNDTQVRYMFEDEDSVAYELKMPASYLIVHHKRLRYNEPSNIIIKLHDVKTGRPIADTEVSLTIINKGRRKKIEIVQSSPGIFEGDFELNFSGLSTLDFEVAMGSMVHSATIDQEVIRE
jgi:hypothetical protein